MTTSPAAALATIASFRSAAPRTATMHVPRAALRILFVSDDAQRRALLRELLATHGMELVTVGGASKPLAERSAGDCDAAIVDSAAPHAAARWARALEAGSRVPTIALAAIGGVVASALWNRVDAVLHEPYDARRLLLVLRGLLADRRAAAVGADRALTAGPVTLQPLLNAAAVAGRDVPLTGVETRLLRELMLAASTPVPRERLARCALGRAWHPHDRCLDTHVKRLRRKLGRDRRGASPIRTVRGIGYLLLEQWQPAG